MAWHWLNQSRNELQTWANESLNLSYPLALRWMKEVNGSAYWAVARAVAAFDLVDGERYLVFAENSFESVEEFLAVAVHEIGHAVQYDWLERVEYSKPITRSESATEAFQDGYEYQGAEWEMIMHGPRWILSVAWLVDRIKSDLGHRLKLAEICDSRYVFPDTLAEMLDGVPLSADWRDLEISGDTWKIWGEHFHKRMEFREKFWNKAVDIVAEELELSPSAIDPLRG